MDKDDEYRKRAAEAQAMADRLGSLADKEAWLRVAHGWLSLIRRPRQTAQQNFDDQSKERGTNQDDESKESH